jgi:hypothetical protein
MQHEKINIKSFFINLDPKFFFSSKIKTVFPEIELETELFIFVFHCCLAVSDNQEKTETGRKIAIWAHDAIPRECPKQKQIVWFKRRKKERKRKKHFN